MLRKNDSKWRGSVRTFMASVEGEIRLSTRDREGRDCASNTLRTFDMSFLNNKN